LQIKVKYLADISPIEKISQGDWIDLRCARDIQLHAGEYMQIPLGVAMELPEGYEAIVAPRSSTFRKYKILLTNGIGIIDNSYSGNEDQWTFPAYAVKDTFIGKNERICQFRIQKIQPEIEFVTVEDLKNPNRGGLGSTGRV
jgi:dUTP pyrophosphatase